MAKRDLHALIADYVTANQEKIYRLSYRYMQNQADALDVVQESILKALAKQNTLENPEYIKTWFYRIVVNTAIDMQRKHQKVTVVDEEVFVKLDRGELDDYQDLDLQDTLDKLPPQYRIVVMLKYFEDLKLDEIAQILDVNLNTVKTRLYKALQLLRIEMTEEVFHA